MSITWKALVTCEEEGCEQSTDAVIAMSPYHRGTVYVVKTTRKGWSTNGSIRCPSHIQDSMPAGSAVTHNDSSPDTSARQGCFDSRHKSISGYCLVLDCTDRR